MAKKRTRDKRTRKRTTKKGEVEKVEKIETNREGFFYLENRDEYFRLIGEMRVSVCKNLGEWVVKTQDKKKKLIGVEAQIIGRNFEDEKSAMRWSLHLRLFD